MIAKLIEIGGTNDGQGVPITTPTFGIGRAENCRLRVDNSLVNHIHCQLLLGADSLSIEDCGSAMGTFVNGEKIKWRRALKNGDRISIATMEWEVQLTADTPAARTQPDRKSSVPRPSVIAAPIANGNEAEIVQWVEQAERPHLSPPKAIVLAYTQPEKVQPTRVSAVAAAAMCEEAKWDIIDLLLVAAMGPLALVLLSVLPISWILHGSGALLLVALAYAVTVRINRLQEIRLDELNAAAGVLAVLVLSLMLPSYLMWLGTATVLFGIGLAIVARTRKMATTQWDAVNRELLTAGSLLACIVLFIDLLLSNMFWTRLGGVCIFGAAGAFALLRHKKQQPAGDTGRLLWLLTAIGIPVVLLLGFLFPIVSWWPEWLSLTEWPSWLTWYRFRWHVLRNWWGLPCMRWGLPLFWGVVIVLLVLLHVRKDLTRVSRG